MNRHIVFAAAAWILSFAAAAQISTPTVEADFEKRQSEVANQEYFRVFNRTDLTPEQRDALKVLYAYMPLPDLADYSGDYYLANVDYALKARREMPWGAKVPDREWRHFVLPVRVNNENLDTHRAAFYEELKERVKGLSMKDAILEINHWCHEKATYEPSDSRTHSPLATVSSAIGRCGEESVFTVSALRAMGIPARQIYTPRWAHTDDNHAWVEAYADGEWFFLGACEPEPVLNLGWFNAPASRGMMMTTRVFGNYDGPEEVLSRPAGYTEINVTVNYAPVDTIRVNVVGTDGKPAANAEVTYRLYNYSEFYPIATKKADSDGSSWLCTGLGDILVWASDGTNFGFTKGSVGKDREVTVTIDCTPTFAGTTEFDLIPPVPGNNPVDVTPEMAALNEQRKAYEDSLRAAYTATFFTAEKAATLAEELGIDAARLTRVLTDARGNHGVLTEFLGSTEPSRRDLALRLLESLSQKDRSDVGLAVLADQMLTPDSVPAAMDSYILSPRIDDEALTPFRSYFMSVIPASDAEAYRANPALLVEKVAAEIKVIADWYPTSVRMSPMAVDAAKVTNAASRNIYFVAAARSLGIPARIDPVTGKTQWANESGEWVDALFEAGAPAMASASATGTLVLDFKTTGRIDDPKYYTQFSLSKIINGNPQQLGYPEDGTWSSIFRNGTTLDAGQYMLVSGQRMADGGVLARTTFFTVEPGVAQRIPLVIRQDENQVQVIGSLNAENLYADLACGTEKSLLSTTGRGYYIVGLLTPNQEPTNHALRDIAALNPEFEKWGRSMVLLFNSERDAARFDSSLLPALPSTAVYGIDTDGKIAAEIIESLRLQSGDRPIFIIADTFNRIVFVSQGYTIGLGDRLINTIHQLKE
ncbi:MAG: transglutaminase domain-containing protein [Muribaculaceae bacterium]|nr:transglutaminase domain-containing protein [Muribaculaceae bacterium]